MVLKTSSLSFHVRAVLADAISRGFSYPVSEFYTELVTGEYVRMLQNVCGITDGSLAVSSALLELEAGIRDVVTDRDREELESEYIELFEHSHKRTPLHLYGGLYLQSEGDRLETLQRLTSMYRSCGLDMEDGAEHADHLSVVLEFLGLLYRQYGPLQAENDEAGLGQLQTNIRTIINELAWTAKLDQELVARDGHPFYLPLSNLLQAVLALPDE